MNVDFHDAPRPNEQVVYRDLAKDQGGLLLHLESGDYHGLNPTGSAIWKLFDGTRTVGQIAAALRPQFDIAEIDLANEVDQFVGELRRRGLLLP